MSMISRCMDSSKLGLLFSFVSNCLNLIAVKRGGRPIYGRRSPRTRHTSECTELCAYSLMIKLYNTEELYSKNCNLTVIFFKLAFSMLCSLWICLVKKQSNFFIVLKNYSTNYWKVKFNNLVFLLLVFTMHNWYFKFM